MLDISIGFKYMFWAICLAFLFRFIRFVVPIVFSKKNDVQLKKYLLPAEITIWLIFLVYGVQFFYSETEPYAFLLILLLIAILIWVSWFSKDVVAGIVFKLSGKFMVDENIEVEEYSGKIIKIGTRAIEIETKKGQTIHIPYSKMLSEIIIKTNPTDSINSHTFFLEITKVTNLHEAIKEVRKAIHLLPWSSIKRDPQIIIVDSEGEPKKLEVTVYAVEKKHFHQIEEYIRNLFQKRA